MLRHALKLCDCLHPADVGADRIRLRATNSRPYEFYWAFGVFCNTSRFYENTKTVWGFTLTLLNRFGMIAKKYP